MNKLWPLFIQATQGTCFLSYSFSVECPAALRQSFLLQAKEAFAIGLLTKAEGELVTSKQELHTFLKAAYSLTITQKWLGTAQEVVVQATQACQKAFATFYDYHADTQDKDSLSAEIMHLIAQVKLLLRVEPFHNSDEGSFIPDSYRNIKDASVNFTLEGFAMVMQRLKKYHASLCETTDINCKRTRDDLDGARLCITALGTTIDTLNTECQTEACKVSKNGPKGEEPQQQGSDSSSKHPPQKFDLCTTLGSADNLESSWQNLSLSSSGSPIPSSSGYIGSIAIDHEGKASNQSCMTTEFDDDWSYSPLQSTNKSKKSGLQGGNSDVSSHTGSRSAIAAICSSSVSGSSDSEKFEVIQAGIETLGTDEDWVTDVAGDPQNLSGAEATAQSLSQLTLRTSSSSLSGSFSSQSSWEKISTDLNPPTVRKPQPHGLSKAGTKSPGSDENFFVLETLDSENMDSAHDHTHKKHTSQQESRDLSMSSPLQSLRVDPNMDTEVDSVAGKPASKMSSAIQHPNPPGFVPEQCASTDSSFDMLEEKQSGQCSNGTSTEKANVRQRKNTLCYNCIKHNTAACGVPEGQYWLSQQDYQALLAGVCHECLLKRLHSDMTQFKLKKHRTACSKLELALILFTVHHYSQSSSVVLGMGCWSTTLV